jgi:hypothetical protein
MPMIPLMTPECLEGLATARSNDVPVHLGFTMPKLVLAFSRVEPAEHWKNPINKQFDHVLTRAEKSAISAAVAFYTGEAPSIFENEVGTIVLSRGYYAAIGA